ncbi:MAG TPA: RidA family protein [Wenzhouxiangella sp.]|nr:RidA family protein [Wenzhouxiangella sp.]
MSKTPVKTTAAPAAIGPYSQAVRAGNTLYVSGQVPLDPATGELVDGDFRALVERVFDSLEAILKEAGGNLDSIVKLNIFLTDLAQFGVVNELMGERFTQPYPARATVEVSALPKGVPVEMDAVAVLAGR